MVGPAGDTQHQNQKIFKKPNWTAAVDDTTLTTTGQKKLES